MRNPGAVADEVHVLFCETGERHAYLSMCSSRHGGAHSQRCAEHADVRIKILFRFTDNRDLILCWPLIFLSPSLHRYMTAFEKYSSYSYHPAPKYVFIIVNLACIKINCEVFLQH